MPTLRPIDDSFFDTAPVCAEHTAVIAASPDRVWRALAADDAVRSGSRDCCRQAHTGH